MRTEGRGNKETDGFELNYYGENKYMRNIKTKGFFNGNKVIIDKVKTHPDLSYLLLPVLNELKEAYKEKIKQHPSWIDAPVEEIAKLIDELDRKTEFVLESEIMKRATYLIEFELWTKVMELLIYENDS